jgi:hypothetical protein
MKITGLYYLLSPHQRPSARQTFPRRGCSGASLAEIPAVLYILFICLLIPLIVLATITMRAAFFSSVAKDAAHAASKAGIFKYSSPPPAGSQPDAVTLALTTAKATAQALGVVIPSDDSVKTEILANEIANPSNVTVSSDMLPAGTLDPTKFVYSVRVSVTGQIDPLLKFNSGVFGNVPGLTGPVTLSVSGEEMVENPQTLQAQAGP